MTCTNKMLRCKLQEIEAIAVKCLHNQPADDDENEVHLMKALSRIAAMSEDFMGLVEVQAYDIDWDTDGEKAKLPKSMRLMVDPSEDIDETIADRLSDKKGWCVNACSWRMV